MRIELLSTEDTPDGRYCVYLRKTHEDGTVDEGIHIFPKDILEWRAAEYGINPSDVDTLLDIVIAEPYLTPEDWTSGPQLYDESVTVEQAREAHLARCARVKLLHRISTRAGKGSPGSPLQYVRDTHEMHPEALALKRQYVSRTQEQLQFERAEQRAPDGRIRALRAALDTPGGSSR